MADARWLTNPPHFTATSPVENYKQIPLQLQETNPRKYKKKMWPMRTGWPLRTNWAAAQVHSQDPQLLVFDTSRIILIMLMIIKTIMIIITNRIIINITMMIIRDGCRYQNGWSSKEGGGWSFSIQKLYRDLNGVLRKKLQYDFPKMREGGGQRLFGTRITYNCAHLRST